MKRNLSFVVELKRPVCRTPIKPVQEHKNVAKYSRKSKHNRDLSQNAALGE
jgi:hypothetical protein